MTTSPFADPIIYPGMPLPDPAPGVWVKLRSVELVCAVGGEEIFGNVIARWNGSNWECRSCVHPEWDEDTP